ncbi:muconolactone delta-isomerase [Metallosphaera yellowstonensis MK1]|jgi:muconolactone delta-isomerase|uniref:Muconolactone delta-isomerase n=1 Tax=Metallosphaera yellowstonensis MK1 TaxID=671065 RepID=H2C787_9CREN|nr:muconolactone Delta-isomerase family protein [Metallosphaera yellowstonensis]EHP68013.1 muconolactone delta-isomerase [Metallosphaera yellowstonensis MK1]
MLFLVWFRIKQPETITQRHLMQIWQREAEAALPAVKAGTVKGLWKVTGKREVVAVIDASTNEELDEILETLPIIKELGFAVELEVHAIHPYENFYELIKKLAS